MELFSIKIRCTFQLVSTGRIAARRLRHTVVREVLLPPLRDSDFAKIEERNKL